MSYSKEECKRICELTQQYIEWMVYRICGDYAEVGRSLASYTKPRHQPGDLSLQKLYEHFISHAGNKSQGGPAIIKVFGNSRDAEEWKKLGRLLGNFSPAYVCDTSIYSDFDALRQAIVSTFQLSKPTGPVEDYFITIFELGHYLNKFPDGAALYAFLDKRYSADRKQLIRDLIKETGIQKRAFFQMRDALIRDALKELGYINYVKPDGHIQDIALLLGLTTEKASDEQIAMAVESVALDGSIMTPYHLDKFFFLIGSGNFYNHNQDKRDSRWKLFSKRDSMKRKVEFAEFILERLASPPLKVGNRVALLVSSYTKAGLYRGQLGQIKEIQSHSLVKVEFTDDQGHMVSEKTLFPTEFVVLRGWV